MRVTALQFEGHGAIGFVETWHLQLTLTISSLVLLVLISEYKTTDLIAILNITIEQRAKYIYRFLTRSSCAADAL